MKEMNLKNKVFSVTFDEEKGIITSLVIQADPEQANFIKSGKGFCELTPVPYYMYNPIAHHTVGLENYKFKSFEKEGNRTTANFERRGIRVSEIFELEE